MYINGTEETRREIVGMTFDWQAELHKYDIHIAEARGIPSFKEITRPPLGWRRCFGNTATEELQK